jgi:hypothetical protein
MENRLMEMNIGDVAYDLMDADVIICVPGGWIFKFATANPYVDTAPALAAVFVPRPFTSKMEEI